MQPTIQSYQPAVLRNKVIPGISAIDTYIANGGYEGLKAALKMTSEEVGKVVSDSGLRGRGGAGFPTGRKWSFLPPQATNPRPRYLCVNADESEPGTFHDRELIEQNPHQAIEGILITCYATNIARAFIYIRGEMKHGAVMLEQAIAEARAHGFIGDNILGSGYGVEIVVHRGAGAYICGEESALLESLEGKRGYPRLRPPFPAVSGLYASPTVINNIGTLAHVPPIVRHGADWFKQFGTAKTPGPMIYSISGHIERPGNYETPGGFTMNQLIEMAGGVRGGRKLKAFIPGGSSAAILPAEQADVVMDFDSLQAAGSMLGSSAVIVMDETTCMVGAALRMSEFYREESCGKCTPCREGTYWLVQILERLEHGEGRMDDIELVANVATNIAGKSFCLLGDSAAPCIVSGIKHWRAEYEAHVTGHGCPFQQH